MKTVSNILLCVAVCVALASCGALQQAGKRSGKERKAQIVLTDEEQRKFDYFFLEASRMKIKQDYASGFSLLQHCLAINPESAAALYEIAQYYLSLNKPAQGQAAIEKAVENEPDNYWYSQGLAIFYQQKNEMQKAAALLESMSTRFTNKIEPLYSLLEVYDKLKDYDKLIATLDRLEEKTGKSEQLSMEKSRIYLQMKDLPRAYSEIEALTEEYPLEMRYRILLANTYMMNEEKRDDAYNIYKEVLEAEPDNAQAMYSLASYYEQTGQKELHQQQLDTLLLSDKIPSGAKLNAMRMFVIENEQAGGDSIRVINLFDRILQQDHDDAQIPMLYAQYLLSKNMVKESIPIMNRVLDNDPANSEVRTRLLVNAINDEDYQEIMRLCEAGIEHSPDNMVYYLYLAIAYNQAKRADDALAVCQQAAENIKPDSDKTLVSDLYSIMGDIYHTKEMNSDSFASYDTALSYNPSNIGALNNYAYYLSLLRRDLDKAEEMSYKTVKAEPNNATYLDTYAWILFEKGNYAEARLYIDNAMKNDGHESDTIVEHCGDIYYMTGDVDLALKYWKQAQEMGSESKTLKQKIEKKKYIAP